MLRPLIWFLLSALLFAWLAGPTAAISAPVAPLRVGIAGLTHTHVHGRLAQGERGDLTKVGIAEPNRVLLETLRPACKLVYPSPDEMLKKTKPEAVTAFGSIYEHLRGKPAPRAACT